METSASSDTLAPTRVTIPEPIRKKFMEVLKEGEVLRNALATDLTLDGIYSDCWLLLTDKRMLIFNPKDGDYALDWEYDLKGIKGVKVEHFPGNGVLKIEVQQGIFEVLRFSRTLAQSMDSIVKDIQRFLQEGEFTVQEVAIGEVQEGVCRRCGKPVDGGTGLCQKCLEKRKNLFRLMGYLRPYLPLAILSFLLTLAFTALQLTPPYLTKVMVDGAINDKDLGKLALVIQAIVGVYLLLAVINGARSYLMQWLGQHIVFDMRCQLYEHLQALSLSFYDKRRTGEIMSRISSDTMRLRAFIVNGAQDIIIEIMTLIGIGIIMFSINWKLAICAIIPAPIIFFGTVRFSKRIHKIYHKVWRRMAAMNALLGDTIPGIRVVKAFGREEDEVDKFTQRNMEVFVENVNAARLQSRFFPTISLATSIGAVIVWGWGGRAVMMEQAGLSLGDLVAFISYMGRFYGPVRMLSNMSSAIQTAATSAERVFEILDIPPDIQNKEDAVELTDLQGKIEFKDVSFHYQGEGNVLKELSFTVEPGQMVGIVGPTGAGKSTLVSLILRFYEVSDGAILIDDQDIRDFKIESLRRQIGIVLQDSFLFHGTIADNIAYGNPESSRMDIIAAAKLANAHDFIMKFPEGYDTLIGERGTGLSGGEKQRISIARAMLKDPRILILDEATSAVDTETEKLIQEALERLIKGRTTVAIAHRLSTLSNADKLLVLERGRLVEEGSHEELLSRDGLFAHLVKLQTDAVAKAG